MNVENVYARQAIIQRMKRRFTTYGYEEILTPTFEAYDLYAKMNGTVNHREMIKTIDNTGEVLVLRPDITIPLTEQLAKNNEEINERLRYFYVLDVFRQAQDTNEYRESTQAGVEYFGSDAPEADAEIIALAIHLLRDVRVNRFTIELGHSGFFKQLITQMKLEKAALAELIEHIQAKNTTEIDQFVKRHDLASDLQEVISALPFLYGNPLAVIEKANKLPLHASMRQTLTNIQKIYHVLQSYGIEQHVVLDLSLINHMDYYSDIIFQGFIEKVGKPVLMGGRYDTLANQFGASIPAIGFAFDIDLLLSGIETEKLPKKAPLDAVILFNKKEEQLGLALANELRNNDYVVLTCPNETKLSDEVEATWTIRCLDDRYELKKGSEIETCATKEAALQLLERKDVRNEP